MNNLKFKKKKRFFKCFIFVSCSVFFPEKESELRRKRQDLV